MGAERLQLLGRACRECGLLHAAPNPRAEYCSAVCKNRAEFRRRAYRRFGPPAVRICPWCHRPFWPTTNGRGRRRTYCRPPCKQAARDAARKQARQPQVSGAQTVPGGSVGPAAG